MLSALKRRRTEHKPEQRPQPKFEKLEDDEDAPVQSKPVVASPKINIEKSALINQSIIII